LIASLPSAYWQDMGLVGKKIQIPRGGIKTLTPVLFVFLAFLLRKKIQIPRGGIKTRLHRRAVKVHWF
jgi:hypothetical protein